MASSSAARRLGGAVSGVDPVVRKIEETNRILKERMDRDKASVEPVVL